MSEGEQPRDPRRKSFVAGTALIVLGLVLFLMRLMEGPSETVIFFALGGLFLAWYLHRRRYGLLIPACILLGLGLGTVGDRWLMFDFDSYETVGLGVGFASIFLIDVLVRGGSHWWPLIPGAILIASGIGLEYRAFDWVLDTGWPLILVVVGLLLLLGAAGRSSRS